MDLNVIGTDKIKCLKKCLGDKPIRPLSTFGESISEQVIQPPILMVILKPNYSSYSYSFQPLAFPIALRPLYFKSCITIAIQMNQDQEITYL